MVLVGISAAVVSALSVVGVIVAALRAIDLAHRASEASDRLVDAAYDRAALLAKVAELRAANSNLFDRHAGDTAEIASLREVVEDWATAYEKLVEEVEGDDGGEWPGDDDGPDDSPDDGPDDSDGAVTESYDDSAVTDEMLRPSSSSRDWLRAHDIDWGDDDTG